MKKFSKKLISYVLILAMIFSVSVENTAPVRADAAESDYAECATLKEGVKANEDATTYIYNGFKPDLGNKFVNSEKHSMVYYESRSVYDADSDTWSEASEYEQITIGFASTLPEYAVTESKPGVYRYSWKAYCSSEKKLSKDTYTVTITVNDPTKTTYEMTFYVGKDIKGDGKNPKLKLYPTKENDDIGHDAFDEEKEIELSGGEIDDNDEYRVYKASLKGGSYSYRTWGYDEDTDDYTNPLGGMSVTVPMATNVTQSGLNELSVYIRNCNIYSPSKYDGQHYLTKDQFTTEVACPYYNCIPTPGTPYESDGYTYYPYMLIAQGNACLYNYEVIPNDDMSEQYNIMFGSGINATVLKGATPTSFRASLAQRLTAKITAPKGAKAEVFYQLNNFNDSRIDCLDKKDNGDGTQTWMFYVPKSNANYTYRVSKKGFVTKAGYMSLGSEDSANVEVKLDREDTKSHDRDGLGTQVSKRDEANLIMNINDQNQKNIGVDETFRLRAYRVWEIINSDTANIMIEPDFNYEILSGAENISVKKVETNRSNGNGNWMDITGVKEGTAVVAVTYDAIDVDGSSSHGGFYPAISPKRTGIVVINVGESDSDIRTVGVKNNAGKDWNWNYDTFFYIAPETSGVINVEPKAESGINSVEVAGATTDEELKTTIGEWKKVEAKDGSYPVEVTEGNNIIKVTSNNGSVEYQVVRAAQVNVNYANQTNPGEKIMPGDTVAVTFNGLFRTVPKISGIFNPVILQVLAVDPAGETVTGQISQYQVADSATINVTIPKDIKFEEGSQTTSYSFTDAYINLNSMYSYANAWQIMYDVKDFGVGTNFNAVTVKGTHSTISNFSIPVDRKVTFDTSFSVKDAEGNEITDYNLTVKDNEGNVLDDYSALEYGKYEYHVEKDGYNVADGTFKLGSETEEKDGKVTINIALTGADKDAWDGKSTSEPEQDEDGTYIISNPAQYAWFAEKVNESAAKSTCVLNAKLAADLDFAGYQVPQIGYYASTSDYVYYGGKFDGDNHVIKNYRFKKEGTSSIALYGGMFAYVSGAEISNFTIHGEVKLSSNNSIATANSGAICGYAIGSKLTNITSYVNVSIKRKAGNWQSVAGISGYSKESEIRNVKNLGTIHGYRYVGGIVGNEAASTSKETIIENAVNEGKIIADDGYAAGIVSYVTATGTAKFKLSNALNTGDIVTGKSGNAGGVAGYLNANLDAQINNCVSLGTVTATEKVTTAGSVFGAANRANLTRCYGISDNGSVYGTCNSYTTTDDCYASSDLASVLYRYATGKNLSDCNENARAEITDFISEYVEELKNPEADNIKELNEICNENFNRFVLQNEKVSVKVNAQDNNSFIDVLNEIEVDGYKAESYGFSDSVTDGVSALDVLVAENEYLYGTEFTKETVTDFVNVSGSYVMTAFKRSAAAFMFSINGKYPHDGILTDRGYYTGYTIDQAKVNDEDVVDFYFLQDKSYWSDEIATLSISTNKTTTDKTFDVSLKGYSYVYYGECKDSVIENNTHAISGAKIGIVDANTGKVTTIEGAVTDENGNATVSIEKAGNYIITAVVDGEDATPIFMPLGEITIDWAKPVEVRNVAIAKQNNNEVSFLWQQNLEQIRLGQLYNVYIDGELYNTYPAASTVTYVFDKAGKHEIKVTATLNGFETEGKTIEVNVVEPETEAPTTEAPTTEAPTTEAPTTEVNVDESTTASESVSETTTASESASETTTKSELQTTGGKTKTTTGNKLKKSVIKKATKKKASKKAKITLRKVSKVKGYQIKVSTSVKFAKKKSFSKKYKTTKIVLRKLKPGKKYYVKVRTYKKINGKICYSEWSKAKKIKFN